MAGEAAGVTEPSGGVAGGDFAIDPARTRIRVLVVDDDRQLGPMLAESLTRLPDFEVVGICADGEEALAFVLADPPDVVMMDLQMPRMDGYTATRRIRQADLPSRVIALTNLDTEESVTRVLAAGSHGCLAKGSRTALIADAIKMVARHGVIVLPDYSSSWLGKRLSTAVRYGLTERQLRILKYIAGGVPRAAIVKAENISISTLKSDVRTLERQLGARGWDELASRTEQLHLL